MKSFTTLPTTDLIHILPPPLPLRFVAGGIIYDSLGRILILQRSFTNKSFPGCWDIPGGYIENGESILTGLFREIKEETCLSAGSILECIKTFEWEKDTESGKTHIYEFIFIFTLTSDNQVPIVDRHDFESYYWISENEIAMVMENRPDNDPWMIEVLNAGFEWYREKSSCLPKIINEAITSNSVFR